MSRTYSFRELMNVVRIVALAAALITGVVGCVFMALDLRGLWSIAVLFGSLVFVTVIAAAFSGQTGGPLPTHGGFDTVNPASGLPYDSELGLDAAGNTFGRSAEFHRR